MTTYPIGNLEVAAVYQAMPPQARQKLLAIRQIIFDYSRKCETIGDIEESLKWGVPSYVAKSPKSGTPIRLQWKSDTAQYGVFVHCQTTLIADFKDQYPSDFKYEKNRGILFHENDVFSEVLLKEFLKRALLYHTDK